MKLIIMPSRQGQYAPITLSVSRLVMLVALLLVAAMIAGAAPSLEVTAGDSAISARRGSDDA